MLSNVRAIFWTFYAVRYMDFTYVHFPRFWHTSRLQISAMFLFLPSKLDLIGSDWMGLYQKSTLPLLISLLTYVHATIPDPRVRFSLSRWFMILLFCFLPDSRAGAFFFVWCPPFYDANYFLYFPLVFRFLVFAGFRYGSEKKEGKVFLFSFS